MDSEVCKICGGTTKHAATCPAYQPDEAKDDDKQAETEADQEIRKKNILEYKAQTNLALEKLLKSNISLEEIAKTIGAEDFLVHDKRAKAGNLVRFDVKAFMDHQIKTGTFLELPSDYKKLERIIIPPGEGEIVKGGGTGLKEAAMIPRTQYLAELLSELSEPYEIIDGITTDKIVRNESYVVFYVPGLDKLILVNNESGNRSFIVHDFSETGLSIEDFLDMTKDELKNQENIKIDHLAFQSNWKEKMMNFLVAAENEDEKPILKSQRTRPMIYEGPAPDGWQNMKYLLDKFDVTRIVIDRLVRKYRKEHPEWERYHGKNKGEGPACAFFHPDMQKMIIEEMEGREFIPDGWETVSALAERLGRHRKIVEQAIATLLVDHPDWQKEFNVQIHQSRSSRLAACCHPELIKRIEQEFSKYGPPPTGWQQNKDIAKDIDRSKNFVVRFAGKYRESNPEWFQHFETEPKRHAEYYHPDLIKLIREEVEGLEEVPEGWELVHYLSKRLKRDHKYVRDKVEAYRADHPEWFKNYVTKHNKVVREHLHPDLVKKIESEII